MFSYIWPLALVVLSNIVYHICTKSSPEAMDPFASLTVTYFIGAVFSGALYFVFNRNGNLLREFQKLNWSPLVLGLVIVGLEVGYIFAFRAGWPVSSAAIVQTSFVGMIMLFVGYFAFNEAISVSKICGMLICLVGLYFLNK